MIKQFLITILIFSHFISLSQNKITQNYEDSNIKLSAKVIERDSLHWLISEIKLLKNVCVKIPQRIVFDYGLEKKNPFSNAGILFAKNIRFSFVYFVMDDELTMYYPQQGYDKFVCLKPDSTVKVEVNLQSMYPIEKGTYKVHYFIDVLIEGKRNRIFSEPIFFEAKHDPPRCSRF